MCVNDRKRTDLYLFVSLVILIFCLTSCLRPLEPLRESQSIAVVGHSSAIEKGLAPIPPFPHFSTATPIPIPTPTPERFAGSLTVALSSELSEKYTLPMMSVLNRTETVSAGSWLRRPLYVLDELDRARVQIEMMPLSKVLSEGEEAKTFPLMERYYAVVVPFDTVQDDIRLAELRMRWQGRSSEPLYVTEQAAADLSVVLGERKVSVLSEKIWRTQFESTAGALGILPFDQLDPSYKVLTIDGANVLSNQLKPAEYPLAVALSLKGTGASLVRGMLQLVVHPKTNRDPNRLTTLIMTGVTAMTRGTAQRMEQEGYTYPAEVISGTLRLADITHISNEVPFLDDCVVNAARNNLVMCSHTNYWASLEALGTDIVGLSGNHVNDFGRSGARRSLGWYRENKISIYGSGLNTEEACAPLIQEHNGNRMAFIAALAFGPSFAWATDELPGACYYYQEKDRVMASIAELAEQVDLVAIELQYAETYNPYPTSRQVLEFRELREAGAHIVTGVQSHVPQAMEPYGATDDGGAGIIVYGLGNLFFDQMWRWETRTELMARHTIYQGRLISTEILTTVLEDYAQPRWTTLEERDALLESIFRAAPTRP